MPFANTQSSSDLQTSTFSTSQNLAILSSLVKARNDLEDLAKFVKRSSSINSYYRHRIFNRHKCYLNNQWWNAHLSEHNIETTFLSEVDWRANFISSILDKEKLFNKKQKVSYAPKDSPLSHSTMKKLYKPSLDIPTSKKKSASFLFFLYKKKGAQKKRQISKSFLKAELLEAFRGSAFTSALLRKKETTTKADNEFDNNHVEKSKEKGFNSKNVNTTLLKSEAFKPTLNRRFKRNLSSALFFLVAPLKKQKKEDIQLINTKVDTVLALTTLDNKQLKQAPLQPPINFDFLIDYPDFDQHYNPKNRRWILKKENWNYWYSYQQIYTTQIYNFLIFECFIRTINFFDANREILDNLVSQFLKLGLIKNINLIYAWAKFTS